MKTSSATKPEKKLSIDKVWELFHESRQDCYRNLLMEHYRDLVKYAAERLHSKLPDKVELDDLVSAGIFGLMDAIDAYDPARGVKFETYCAPRIKGSILDELRSMDWVPRLVRARAHQLARATHALEMHLGRKPDENELAEELDMDMDEFIRLQRDANAASLVSLSTKCGDGDGEKERTDPRRKAHHRPVLFRGDDDEGDRRDAGPVRVSRLADALIDRRPAQGPDEHP